MAVIRASDKPITFTTELLLGNLTMSTSGDESDSRFQVRGEGETTLVAGVHLGIASNQLLPELARVLSIQGSAPVFAKLGNWRDGNIIEGALKSLQMAGEIWCWLLG